VESHICQKPGSYPYFLYAVPKSATCAAFIKESRMEFLEANQLHRKYGLWGTRHLLRIEISLPDLASPDFLWNSVVLANFIRLSLLKGASAVSSSAAWQEIRVREMAKKCALAH
jgi:hypothetical protein